MKPHYMPTNPPLEYFLATTHRTRITFARGVKRVWTELPARYMPREMETVEIGKYIWIRGSRIK